MLINMDDRQARINRGEIPDDNQQPVATERLCADCGHASSSHLSGYTCQKNKCHCLDFKPADTQPPAPVGTWRLREGTSVITSDEGDVAIVVGQVTGGKLTSKRAQRNAETIINAPTNQQRIAELEAALCDVTRELDEIVDVTTRALMQFKGNFEIRVQPSMEAVANARAVLNRGGER